ncbi:hypothetical protein C7U89_29335 [Bradyrhizobium sp. WBOS4]|nr:hypothetical protein [Bradyrhizobium sp. WBOS8]MDD1587006.1 hypothetical protein [Bradyrhizobium sp. WBOS4]UUO48745.1 hypothetical protein DCM78_18625 [Bradyrhizobium sp. WBOS04]UUO62565.1 hypothetical protein DCM80_27500 [Bradyrhizobium sp. WBOS08]
MRLEGRISGESIWPTMPLLTGKSYRRGGPGAVLGANPDDFTPQTIHSRQFDGCQASCGAL